DSNPTSTLYGGGSWKSDKNPATPLGFGHTDAATVEIDRPAGDRQAQTGAAVAARTVRPVDAAAVEPLEDAVPFGARNAGPLVQYLELQGLGAPAAPRLDRHPAVRRAVLDRVVDQVGDHLVDALRVGVRGQLRRGYVEVQVDVRPRVTAGTGGHARPRGGDHVGLLQHARQVRPHLEAAPAQRDDAVVQPGQVEQRLHQPAQTLG